MVKQDIERGQSEQTPLQSSGTESTSEGKKVKAIAKAKAQAIAKAEKAKAQAIAKAEKAKAQAIAKTEEASPCKAALCLICCSLFALSPLVYIVYIIVNYYIETFEDREEKDSWEVSVSEQWIDYLSPTNKQVNCTNSEPCRNWNCSYVKEHFLKDMDECEYDDYMNWVSAALVIWVILMILAARS